MSAAATNGQYLSNRLIGTSAAAPLMSLYAVNGQNHSNVLIGDNYFTGTSLSAIRWLCSDATATSTINKLTISSNAIVNLSISEPCLNLRAEDDTSTTSTITDLVIDNNLISSVTYNAMSVGSDYTVFGLCKGLKIRSNTIINSASSSNASGGGMAPMSWAQSSTYGFGVNEISNNVIRKIRGQTGGINAFYSSVYIHNNLIEDAETLTIDANGILLDVGCSSCVVAQNEINNCLGKAGVANAGYALMVLSCVDINMYSNVGTGNRNGIHYGASGSAQSVNAYNNTFANCIENAFLCNASANLNNCTLKMNIFTGTGFSVFDATATKWTGEDYNCFYGFSSGSSSHVLGSNDLFINPSLDSKYWPLESRVQRGNQPIASIDFYGNKFSQPGPMGGVQYPYSNSLMNLKIIANTGYDSNQKPELSASNLPKIPLKAEEP